MYSEFYVYKNFEKLDVCTSFMKVIVNLNFCRMINLCHKTYFVDKVQLLVIQGMFKIIYNKLSIRIWVSNILAEC